MILTSLWFWFWFSYSKPSLTVIKHESERKVMATTYIEEFIDMQTARGELTIVAYPLLLERGLNDNLSTHQHRMVRDHLHS
jgi:hypothetical protein